MSFDWKYELSWCKMKSPGESWEAQNKLSTLKTWLLVKRALQVALMFHFSFSSFISSLISFSFSFLSFFFSPWTVSRGLNKSLEELWRWVLLRSKVDLEKKCCYHYHSHPFIHPFIFILIFSSYLFTSNNK